MPRNGVSPRKPIPEAGSRRHETFRVPSDLTAEQIRDSFGTPSSIAIWDLPAFISSLERAGFSARKHYVWLHMELALPLLLAAMVLVGAGFTMRHARSGRVRHHGASGHHIGLRNLPFAQLRAGSGGKTARSPVLIAAWSPPVAAALLSLSLILHLEDGLMRRTLLALIALCLLISPLRAQDKATLIADRVFLEADNTLTAEGAVEVLYQGTRADGRAHRL